MASSSEPAGYNFRNSSVLAPNRERDCSTKLAALPVGGQGASDLPSSALDPAMRGTSICWPLAKIVYTSSGSIQPSTFGGKLAAEEAFSRSSAGLARKAAMESAC